MNARAAVEAAADRFGGQARETILGENLGKHARELDYILDRLPSGGTAVDLGGGVGVNLLALRLMGSSARLVLIDRFEEYDADNKMGEAGRAIALLQAHDIEVHNSDLLSPAGLPLEEAVADVVTLFDVVEHLPKHPLGLLAEAKRCLRDGGSVLLGGPNSIALTRRVELLFGRHPYIVFDAWVKDPYFSHVREYTSWEYGRLLGLAGFADVRTWMSPESVRQRARTGWRHGRASLAAKLAFRAVDLAGRVYSPFQPAAYAAGRRID